MYIRETGSAHVIQTRVTSNMYCDVDLKENPAV